MGQPEILIIGELIQDLIAVEKDFSDVKSFQSSAGGPAGNVAVNLRQLGTNCAVISAVGADPPGDFLQQYLRRHGVDLTLLQVDSGARTPVVCVWNVREEPRYFPLSTRRPRIRWTPEIEQSLPQSRLVALSSSVIADDEFFAGLDEAIVSRRADCPQLVMDLNLIGRDLDGQLEQRLRRLAPGMEYLQVSWMNLLGHYPQIRRSAAPLTAATDWLQSLGCPGIVLTRGRDGYRLITRGIVQDVAVAALPVCSSSGAGDGFFAGVLQGLLQGWPLAAALRQGENTARLVLGRIAPHLAGD